MVARWGPALLVIGFLFGAVVSIAGAQPRPEPRVVERRFLTPADRQLLREVLAAVTTTTAPLPPAQVEAVAEARDVLAAVETGDVEVRPAPPTSTTPTTTSTTTTVPPVTTPPSTVADFEWPPTTTVPPPFTVVEP